MQERSYLPIRIIPRLDVKGQNVVKGVHMEGLRVVGDPATLAEKYYEAGADEILYMDIVASLYGRPLDLDLVKSVADKIHIPLMVGGGIRSIRDIEYALRAGADKIAINTFATKDPAFLGEAVRRFGAQCVTLSVEAKRQVDGRYEAYTDGGRERSGREVVAWIKEAHGFGIGEISITSIDRDGTRRGFDHELTKAVNGLGDVPVVVHGGAGDLTHILEVIRECEPSAVSLATMLHYDELPLLALKADLARAGLHVRV